MWYSDGKLCSMGKAIDMAAETDRFRYVASDSMEAVIYVSDDAVRKSTLYASFNDGSRWGAPIALTGVTGNISSFSADLLSDGTLSIVACERELNENSKNYLGEAAYLRHYTVTPCCDVAVTRVNYLPQSMSPGGKLILEVDVENRGMTYGRFVNLAAEYGGQQVAVDLQLTKLASGETKTVYFNVPLPENLSQIGEITVTAGLDGQIDDNPSDNSGSVRLRLHDLSVEEAMAKTDGETTIITALVANRGREELSDIAVQLMDGETVLQTQMVESLSSDNGIFVRFQLEEDLKNGALLTLQAAVEGLDVTQENIVANNICTIMVEVPEKEIFRISGTAEATDAGASAVVELYNSTGESQTIALCAAAYDGYGKLLDACYDTVVSYRAQQQVILPLEGSEAVKTVRIFILDSDYKPLQESVLVKIP